MTRKEVDLCSLPPDCLRLILSKVDYGRNRQALWALSGSCKTVREALRECPAVVELFGKWNRKSLLKLFAALPEMASLSLHGPPYLGFDTPSRSRAQRDVKSICTWLGQSNLKALDLRDMEAAVSDRIVSDEWDDLKGITLLPEGLQRLTVLCLDPPSTLEDEINNLADLTCLVSKQLGIWPSLDLTGLKHLSVLTRNSRGYESQHDVSSKRTDFFQHTLVRLSNLTKLDFDLEGLDEELEHHNLFDEERPSSIPGSVYKLPSSIQELTLELNSLKQYKHLVPLLTALPCLQSLKLSGFVYEPDEDEDEDEEEENCEKEDVGLSTIDLLGAPLDNLRDLTMEGLNIGLPIIRAPNLTSLRFLAPRAHYECQNLKSASIMRIAATTSIRQLELSHWRRWDDLQPLAALPLLKHLSIDQGVHVLEAMLKPGCLTSLEMLTLRGVRKGTQLKNKKRLALIKKGLLALPKFRLLACPGDSLEWDDDQRGADAVDAIVNLHKEKWRCLYSKGSERLYEKV